MQLTDALPKDLEQALLIGRLLTAEGPTPVTVRSGRVFDMSAVRPTVSALLAEPATLGAQGQDLGMLAEMDIVAAGGGSVPRGAVGSAAR